MLGRCLVVAIALVCGCGAEPGAAPDMARGPMEHPPLWRLASGTIPVQAAPEVWPVVWQGDEAIGAAAADFLGWMLQSDYFRSSLGEYGIGAGVAHGLIVVPSPPPATLSDEELGALSTALVASGQITRSDNTQVAFLVSPNTAVTAGGAAGCDVFAGYHSHGGGSPDAVAYSVALRCEGEAGQPIDQLTRVLSHEVAEAASDPAPSAGLVDKSPGGQEIADLCNFGQALPVDVPPDATHAAPRRYWVQRLYSDARAADGTIDPCVPLGWDRPYWNVALDPPLLVAAPSSTSPLSARLDVFAYGDVGLIRWFASSDGAEVEPAGGEAHAGDTIAVTVTPTQGLHAGQAVEIDILSESQKAGSQIWFAYVQAQAK